MTDVSACRTRPDYDAWCRTNMGAFNRLSVKDPAEWERIARKIDVLQERFKKMELVE